MGKAVQTNSSTFFTPEVSNVAITSLTTTVTSDKFGTDRYSGLIFFIDVGTVTGTNPTLDIKLQTIMPDGTTATAIQIAATAQITTGGKYGFGFVASGNATFTDGTLAASAFKTIPLGRKCSLLFTVGGTNSPTFPINSMYVILIA